MAGDQPLLDPLGASPTEPGFVLWFTGLPAAGKTTLAHAVQRALAERQIHSILLDSDELRKLLTPQPTYSASERDWFYSVVAGLAAWLARSGVNVLIAATANRRLYRQVARDQIERFAEVYVVCSLATCQQRDPKGIYARACTSAGDQVPGLGSTFEPPEQPEVVVDTDRLSVAEGTALILQQLEKFLAIPCKN
jgi:adenylylsulfate kinase